MAARYGTEDAGTLRLNFWLIVKRGALKPGWGKHRDAPTCRVTAGEPGLSKDERAMNLEINLPSALFELPSLHASITVDAPRESVSINVDGLAEAVKKSLGMDVDFRVVEPKEPGDE